MAGAKFGCYIFQDALTFEEILKIAQQCEELGLESVWLKDNFSPWLHKWFKGQKTVPSAWFLESWTTLSALASLTIFQFLWVWNDLLVALIYAQNPSLQPLTVAVNNLLSTYGPEWDLLSAAAFFTMAVPLVIFFSLQKYFVSGLLAGSVKS